MADEDPVLDTDFSNCIVIDGLPAGIFFGSLCRLVASWSLIFHFFTVTMDKYDRLNTFLLKKFGAFGTMVAENFFMPFDPEKGTLGFVDIFFFFRSHVSA